MKSTAEKTPSTQIQDIAAAATQLAYNNGYATDVLISTLEQQILSTPAINQEESEVSPAYINDISSTGTAVLVVRVSNAGDYLTYGEEDLLIPLDVNDNTVQTAVDQLFESSPKISSCITLGNKSYTFDHQLKYDVYDTLMGFLGNIQES